MSIRSTMSALAAAAAIGALVSLAPLIAVGTWVIHNEVVSNGPFDAARRDWEDAHTRGDINAMLAALGRELEAHCARWPTPVECSDPNWTRQYKPEQ